MITQQERILNEEVKKSLEYLLDPDQIVEVRIVKATNDYGYSKRLSGYFNDFDKLIKEVQRVEREYKKIESFYFTPNPVTPQLLARSKNELIASDFATKDSEIERRRYFLIDIDPERPRGTSSTNLQHEKALRMAEEISSYLGDKGWPAPVMADSGNGAHLMYRINIEADDSGLLKNALEVLNLQFTKSDVKVDTSVYNPARIWKLYGTMACKGSDTAECPHRMARILWDKSPTPGKQQIVKRELIEKLAEPIKQAKKSKQGEYLYKDGRFKLESWLAKHKDKLNLISNEPRKITDPNAEVWALKTCPFHSDHINNSYIYRLENGALVFKCFGDRCKDYHWSEFREKIEPGYKSRAVKKRSNENDVGEFFLDTELQTYVFVDIEHRDVITYKNKGDWKNKFKLLNIGRNMPDPFDEMKSVYNPELEFGFFNDEYGIKRFNRFKPSEYWFRAYDADYKPKPTPVFNALYRNVFNGDDTVKKLLAKMLQDHQRFLIIPVVINEQGGAGKGIFEQHVIAPLMGMENCSLNLGQEDLESPYNDYLVDRLYIGFHETEDAAENAGIASKTLRKIKRMFDPTITIEKKYIARVSTPNNAVCFIYSNNSNPVSINKHDRRIYVVRSKKSKLQNIPLFKQSAVDTSAGVDTFQKRMEELRRELPDVVCKLKRMKIEPNFGKCPKSTSAKKDLQDRSNGPIQNFIIALMMFDVDTLQSIATEKRGYYPYDLMDVIMKSGILTTNNLRELVGNISNGKWSFETVRKLMPPVRSTKYNGYVCWKVKKRP